MTLDGTGSVTTTIQNSKFTSSVNPLSTISIGSLTGDVTGAPVTVATPGQTFDLVAYVQDARPLPFGVFSAYANVAYNSSLATVGNLNFGSTLTGSENGTTTTAGQIQDAGAYNQTTTYPANIGLDPGAQVQLWYVPVTVPTGTGSQILTFTPSTSFGDSQSFATSLYNDTPGQQASVNYEAVSVAINGATTPTFEVQPASVTNNTNGTTTLTFNVTLSQAPASSPVAVTVSTQDGTGTTGAKAGTDYVANTQTLTFSPGGALTQTFTVTVDKATAVSVDKTFTVNLSNATGGSALGSLASARARF